MKNVPLPPLSRALRMLGLACLLGLAGCATTAPTLPPAADGAVAELARAIGALADEVDRREADRAARIAYAYSRQLAEEYAITDSALVHNLKVNLGLRDRGLCIHWTRDLLTRLQRERFRTLDLHWAIANFDSPFRLEHSTVVVSARGDTLYRGLVLDPWRNAGALHWAPVLADNPYDWRPRDEVLAKKARIRAAAEMRNNRL